MNKIFHIYYKRKCKYYTLSEENFIKIWNNISDKKDYEYIELINEENILDETIKFNVY